MKKFEAQELVIATHNAGKAREISELLKPYIKTFVMAGDLGLPEPAETGVTFFENATIKALAAARASGKPALADDSGLCVNVLNGDPGVYSADWAGPDKNFAAAMQMIHDKMGNAVDRSAAFVCVLALAWPDGHCETFEGRIEGDIIWPPRGDKGFGYDPFFRPAGYEQSYAEIDAHVKNKISHRARAFEKLVQSCFEFSRD